MTLWHTDLPCRPHAINTGALPPGTSVGLYLSKGDPVVSV